MKFWDLLISILHPPSDARKVGSGFENVVIEELCPYDRPLAVHSFHLKLVDFSAPAEVYMPSTPKHCSSYFVLPIVGVAVAVIAYRAALSAQTTADPDAILSVRTLAAFSLQQVVTHELDGALLSLSVLCYLADA